MSRFVFVSVFGLLSIQSSFIIAQSTERLAVRILFDRAIGFLEANPDSALMYSLQASEIAEETDDLWLIGVTKQLRSDVYNRLGKEKLGFINGLSALKSYLAADTIDHCNLSSLYQGLSMTHSLYDNYDEATLLAEQSFDHALAYYKNYPLIVKQRGDEETLYNSAYNLLVCYSESEDFTKSFDLIDQLFDLNENLGYWIDEFDLWNERVILNQLLGNHFKAIAICNETIKKPFEKNELGILYHNLGNSFLSLQNFEGAKSAYEMAIFLKKSHPEGLGDLAVTQGDLGELFFLMGNYDRAIEAYEKAVTSWGYDENYKNNRYFEIYKQMAQAYDSLGNLKVSDHYLQLYQEYEREFNNSAEILNANEERESFYKLLEELGKEELEAELKRDSLWYILLTGGLVTLVLMLFFMRKRRLKRKVLHERLGDILLDN